MNIQQMQEQLISQISTIHDEDILRMVGEELSFSLESQTDLSKVLSDTDLKELTMLANEPVDKDTLSLNEFNNILDQWRMK